jgi:hypothetical protein
VRTAGYAITKRVTRRLPGSRFGKLGEHIANQFAKTIGRSHPEQRAPRAIDEDERLVGGHNGNAGRQEVEHGGAGRFGRHLQPAWFRCVAGLPGGVPPFVSHYYHDIIPVD